MFCVRRQWSTGMLVGMYLRVTGRTTADGSAVRYVALAHNERVGGQTRARVLRGLGREDGLDTDGLRRLVSSVSRFLGDADPYAAGSGERADLLRMTSSRSMGGAWLLDGLWKQLGIDAALRRLLGPRRFSTDVERVLFALVANRALDPCSKLAAAEWAERDAAIGGPGSMSDDQAYRAMDLLIEADATAKVQEAVFFAVANLLNLEVDVLLFDTTSTYFEAEPDVGPDGEPGFRRYGHSKDHRPDLPQVVIGLAVTKEGIPVRVWSWPGNTSDTSVLPEVRDGMRDWKLGRVVTVVDRGFSSNANPACLRKGGGQPVAGERMRDKAGDAAEALSRQGRFTVVNDHLHVKEAKIDSTPGVRWIICFNTAEAAKDKATRDQAVASVTAELERIAKARAKATTELKSATTAKATSRLEGELAGHTRAECALRDHVTFKRWLRQTSTGRLVIDRAAIAAEEKRAASTCSQRPTST